MFTPIVIGSSVFEANLVIAANTYDYNIRTAAIAAGWNQVTPLKATVVVNSGVYVGASSTGTYAISTGTSYPVGSVLTLINNGYILGAGGYGGSNSNYNTYPGSGGNGGTALNASTPINITNNGVIGGGGGGGGGASGVQGSVERSGGYWMGDQWISAGYMTVQPNGGSGGGGQGYQGGSGGWNGAGGDGPQGAAGGNGTVSSFGAGGAGGDAGGGYYGGTGGNGGTLGSAGYGGTGGWTGPYSSGGAGGYCTSGNANITWSVTGTRYGTLG